MMRPLSLVCMLVAVLSGLYLYRTKYRAQMLDREINQTLKLADDSRARSGMLRADYALLNDPIRLQELVDQYLTLKTTQPTQFTTLADLERRLPPIGITVPEPAPEPDIPAAVIRPEPRQHIAEPLPRPRPTAPPAAPLPAVVASPRPPTPLAPQPSATQAVASAIPPATQLVMRSAPIPAAPRAAAPPAATPPPATSVQSPARPPAIAATPAVAESAPPVVRSALGMARRVATQPAMPPGGGGSN